MLTWDSGEAEKKGERLTCGVSMGLLSIGCEWWEQSNQVIFGIHRAN
jgi:hypothetical protein